MLRIGFGNDIHRLEEGKPLILGGVRIEGRHRGAPGVTIAEHQVGAIKNASAGEIGHRHPLAVRAV